ncbi:Type II secretion system (T2SS), protein F [compost metagenome]
MLERLSQGQPERVVRKTSWTGLDRAFLRAGLGRPTERLGVWLTLWGLSILLGFFGGGWPGLLALLLLPPLLLRLYVNWRYQRRLKRMIEQLPALLDHSVRSLKSGRTLADAVLGAIDAAEDPLKDALGRVKRQVHMGISLPDATSDFAELYDKDELRLFALGLKVNHRYGGNASELLENLIKIIREREQAARQLSAMTGETRMTATVLGLLPVGMAGYFLISNPNYLLTMWQDGNGQFLLLGAFILQVVGCLVLWRMLRSI